MKLYFALLSSMISATPIFADAASPSTPPSASDVLAAISPALRLTKKKPGDFDVSKCPKAKKSELASMLLMNTPFKLRLKFAPGCDVEGDVTVPRDPFPVDVKTKNLGVVERVKATVSADVEPLLEGDDLGRMRVDAVAKNGEFTTASGITRWNGKYAVVIDLSGSVKRELGGKLTLTEHAGRPANAVQDFKLGLEIK